ncbi:MAG: peptidyl-prolyl cis-trans isomerase [Deltaproteobacteria bacterium]|nr:peptidyl-prolyl cis-trans isomerase [Deltaproteobacteria bacterium]
MLFKLRSSKKKLLKTNNQKSKRFWREPLIHFFILGLSVFGLHAALDRKPEAAVNDPYLVEVSSADIEWLRTIFNKRMGHEPTVQDLRGQVNHLIREQILSSEAVAMGLDVGDIVVRRRLAQKMEFLFKDLSAMTEPTEDDLRKYFFENRRKYETSPRVTFTQVYFSIDSRGVEGAKQAAQALIKEDGDLHRVPTLGDASILSPGCTQCSVSEIRNRFGTDFAAAVKNLEPGSWNGPFKSAYGFHAVYIHERQDTKLPKFRDIIDRVKNDWMSAKQEENTRRVYGEIRSRYRVLLEGLPYDFDLKG